MAGQDVWRQILEHVRDEGPASFHDIYDHCARLHRGGLFRTAYDFWLGYMSVPRFMKTTDVLCDLGWMRKVPALVRLVPTREIFDEAFPRMMHFEITEEGKRVLNVTEVSDGTAGS